MKVLRIFLCVVMLANIVSNLLIKDALHFKWCGFLYLGFFSLHIYWLKIDKSMGVLQKCIFSMSKLTKYLQCTYWYFLHSFSCNFLYNNLRWSDESLFMQKEKKKCCIDFFFTDIEPVFSVSTSYKCILFVGNAWINYVLFVVPVILCYIIEAISFIPYDALNIVI